MLIMIIYSFYGNWGAFGECLEPSLSFLWFGLSRSLLAGSLEGLPTGLDMETSRIHLISTLILHFYDKHDGIDIP